MAEEEISAVSGGGDDHQTSIRMILEQVKSGEKNKSQAFHELRTILQSRPDASFQDTSHAYNNNSSSSSSSGAGGVGGSDAGPRFSNEDRRVLINHIIERKKRSEEDTVGAQGALDPDDDTLPSSTVGGGGLGPRASHHRYVSSGGHGDGEERPVSPSSSISGATRSLTGTHGRAAKGGAGLASSSTGTRRYHSTTSTGPSYAGSGGGGGEHEEYSYGGRNASGYNNSSYDVHRGGGHGYEDEDDGGAYGRTYPPRCAARRAPSRDIYTAQSPTTPKLLTPPRENDFAFVSFLCVFPLTAASFLATLGPTAW